MKETKTDEERTGAIAEILFHVPKKEWPKVFWEVSHDRWPEEFGDRPQWVGAEECDAIARMIQSSIGVKACMRYLNTEFGGMTDQMFDDMWDSAQNALHKNGPGNSEDRAQDRACHGNSPIVTALGSLFIGGIGSLLALIVYDLLKLL